MRILQIIPFLTPVYGGAAVVAHQLSRELARRGHEVTIYTGDHSLSAEYVESLSQARVIPFGTWSRWANLHVTPGMPGMARKEIGLFDVVHLHDYRTFQNVVAHRYAVRHRVPYVLQPHGTTPRLTHRKMLKSLFDRTFGYRLFQDAGRVVAVSEEEAGYDREMARRDPDKVVTIYNAMDIESFSELPQRGAFRQKHSIDGTMLLYLGRINESKGIDFLIEAFGALRKQMDIGTLVIAGPDDGYKAHLDRMIGDMGLQEHVRFTGYVDERDKLSAFVDADLFLHTVRYMAGVGIAPLEAILCNTPIVVTPECGEVVRAADCGYLVEFGDIENLITKILRLVENPDEGAEMVKRGKEYIYENLSWDKVIEKHVKVYSEITSN